MSKCILCGGELPSKKWWQRLVGARPTHDANGPDGLACWRGFNRRMGLDPNRPMPKVARR